MPRMTRKQALDRLQAVCDKKGWQDLRLYRVADSSWVGDIFTQTVGWSCLTANTLTDLVAAFERLAQ